MIRKELDKIDKSDIDALLADKVIELATLDYKEELPVRDDDRREVVYDIASLANSRGGDLVFGVEAERDANNKPTGAPRAIVGIPDLNLDAFKLKMLHAVQNTTKPRIQGVDMVAIPGFARGPVVVLRVPRSWNTPHMVQVEKTQRFYARNSAGKFILDVDEIRAAFLTSASLPDRLDALRKERVARVLADDGPVSLRTEPKLIVHVLPFAALTDDSHQIAVKELREVLQFPLISMNGGGSPRVNFDGVVMAAGSGAGRFDGYVQAFRSGLIEVASATLVEGSPPFIGGHYFETSLAMSIRGALLGLEKLGEVSPFFVAITMAGVRGASFATSSVRRTPAIDRDVLFLPEVTVDAMGLGSKEVGRWLKPAFDVAWQSAGADGSPHFDHNGDWKLDAR